MAVLARVFIPAFCVFLIAHAGAARSEARERQTLSAELLIAAGDLARLGDPALSAPNRDGLLKRLSGALGLLPWLLQAADDTGGASRLTRWQGQDLSTVQARRELAAFLDTLSKRHPLALAQDQNPLPAGAQDEAKAIHETYCAGCHDGMENGDPDAELPARDLFVMGRQESRETFLARLVNGVKGDNTIGFQNPLTGAQLRALATYYIHGR